ACEAAAVDLLYVLVLSWLEKIMYRISIIMIKKASVHICCRIFICPKRQKGQYREYYTDL
ncbi:MAG: hypothetical protein MSK46_02650, partial [Bacteroidales bacterium]|nr:hypothetical protein [Bacteroidales bacterium]